MYVSPVIPHGTPRGRSGIVVRFRNYERTCPYAVRVRSANRVKNEFYAIPLDFTLVERQRRDSERSHGRVETVRFDETPCPVI